MNRLRASILIALILIGMALRVTLSTPLQAKTPASAPGDVITSTVAPRNIILFIGDGMGAEHVRAAGMYQHGSGGTLFMESFPYSTTMTTHSADNAITDSAAAATAMATGQKVNNGVISMAYPGAGSELETLLERFHTYCKRGGLVSTTYATHATPAAFGAHEPSRNNTTAIAGDYLTQTRPDVLFGGGGYGLTVTDMQSAGYTVATDRETLQALTTTRAAGLFGTGYLPYEYDYFTETDSGYDTLPHLSEMVTTTLTLLEDTPHGFFLMVEGGRIDHAAHNNEIERTVFEVLEFDRAIEVAYTWASNRADTLIIVTADHETGGLSVTANNGAGNFPTVSWSSVNHTATPVPVYAWGVNAALATQVTDNTDIYHLALAGLTGAPQCNPVSTRIVNFRAHNFLARLSLRWFGGRQ